MTDFLLQPWPWWLSGPLIGLTVPLLYLLAGKGFGISTSLQQLGAMCLPNSKLDYLKNFDRRKGAWTLIFALGIAIGGLIGSHWLSAKPIEFLPSEFFSLWGATKLFIGGTLIGFGARYAGGCTSGHAITGIANWNLPSVIATISFFIGGVGVTWGLGHILF
jgi:uncharacterized membrane protein YedE/YeeE